MICNTCGIDKKAPKFCASKWCKRGHEARCRQCRITHNTMRRYKISKEFLTYLYTHDYCMVCGIKFSDTFDRCLHHTKEGAHGLVCRKCNYALGQDDVEALRTINCALAYMKMDRSPICFISELPRIPRKHTQRVTKCSSADAHGGQCNNCKNFYTKDSFYSDKRVQRDICWECNRGHKRLSKSKPVKEGKQKTTHCECCDSKLSEKFVHHVGDIVYGVICRRCNVLLKDESKEQIDRLLAAKLWMEQDDLEWVMT